MLKAIAAASAIAVSLWPPMACAGSAITTLTVLDNCQNRKLDPDVRIAACTQLIHSNLVSHTFLSAFYDIRGGAYFDKGDDDDALQDFNKAIELEPDFAAVLNNRAIVFDHEGKPDRAAQDYDAAGFAHLQHGECSLAVSDYSAALQRDPKRASALYGRGICKSLGGDVQGGQADSAAALAIDPRINNEFAWPK